MRNRYFAKMLVLVLTLSVLMSGCLNTQPPASTADPAQTQNSTTIPSNTPTDSSQTTNPSDESTAPAGDAVPNATTPTPSAAEPSTTGPTPTNPAPTVPKPTESATTAPATTAPATTTPATTTPATTKPAPTTPSLPADEAQPALEMQGLKALKAHSQSANLVQAYERIANGVAGTAQTIDLQGLELTADLLKMAYECYCNDYPQHFWLASTYTYTTQNNVICSISPQYHMTGSELTAAKTKFDQAVNSILGKLSGSMSAYEKELAIHDALLNQCQYKKGNYPYSAYGALVEGMAVCEGYARAFQYLMHKTGISCMVVSGFGNGEAHAWNAVQIGSSWYYTDITWDDPLGGDGTLHYAYFNLTRAAMDWDHTADMAFIPLPNAAATTYNYFVRNGTYLQQYDQFQLAQILRRDNPARLYVAGDVDGFIQSFNSNISAILAEAGIQDCTGYSYKTCGKELIITLRRGT